MCVNHHPQELAYHWLAWECEFSFNAEYQLLGEWVGGGGREDIKDNGFSDSELAKVCVCGDSDPLLESFRYLNSPQEQ